MDFPKSDYKQYPKTLPRDDLWGQVRRTVFGRRITEHEVEVIVESILDALQLSPTDQLLDLACGNGALTERLFSSCAGVVGVDWSAYLIEIARERFERPPEYVFIEQEILDYVRAADSPQHFTKALCYASLQFLSTDAAMLLLTELHRRFENVERVFVGNVPDRTRADVFFTSGDTRHEHLSDPTSQIGVWYSEQEMLEMATRCGWSASISRLPAHIFNAAYRYDVILDRA